MQHPVLCVPLESFVARHVSPPPSLLLAYASSTPLKNCVCPGGQGRGTAGWWPKPSDEQEVCGGWPALGLARLARATAPEGDEGTTASSSPCLSEKRRDGLRAAVEN